ncbi:hypothetical protein D3C73_1440180 [compost metagenome]
MERVAFQAGTLGGSHQETVIKIGVMRHNYRPVTAAILNALAHRFKNSVQCIVFTDRTAQGITRIYAVKSQRFGLQVGTFKRLHVKMQGFVLLQPAVFIHF